MKLLYLAAYSAGAATGVAATYVYFKKKYEKIAQEEIDSVKKTFKQNKVDSGDISEEEEDVPEVTEEIKQEYKNVATDYTKYSTEKTQVKEDEHKPKVISPEEFGEEWEYDTATLFYFADGYLTDDANKLVEDVDKTVGLESLKTFGQYEDDSVFVRNDNLKCDFEILMDTRNFKDLC